MANRHLARSVVLQTLFEWDSTHADASAVPEMLVRNVEEFGGEDTDKAFNKGLQYCVDNINNIGLMCGSHNDYSNRFLTVLIDKHGLKPADKRVWFAQLLGMSDQISFNLSKAGYNVAKYVPYGPVKAVMPYLIRRANENTSVAGQSSRELQLIRKELRRRHART